MNANLVTAPGLEPDLDDSAKSSIILSLLGGKGFTSHIVEYFDSYSASKHTEQRGIQA